MSERGLPTVYCAFNSSRIRCRSLTYGFYLITTASPSAKDFSHRDATAFHGEPERLLPTEATLHLIPRL